MLSTFSPFLFVCLFSIRKCCEPSPECSLSLAYYHPDCITDAATLLWNPYCIAMCHEIDQINVETFVNPSLLSLAITCVQAACIAFEKVQTLKRSPFLFSLLSYATLNFFYH